jgi:hypothetical protein
LLVPRKMLDCLQFIERTETDGGDRKKVTVQSRDNPR